MAPDPKKLEAQRKAAEEAEKKRREAEAEARRVARAEEKRKADELAAKKKAGTCSMCCA